MATHRPIASILSCSDARVAPEFLFDQGPGDLFVVRVAGNVLTDEGLASLEYAAQFLGSPLVFVELRRLGFRFVALADDNFYPVTFDDLARARRRGDPTRVRELEALREERFALLARLAELPDDLVGEFVALVVRRDLLAELGVGEVARDLANRALL
mgnify:CR=1 FL=1